jgi:predicted ATP-dependent endonuclease of OLD family
MELKRIQIKNFRSIKDEEITFNHNCLALLGKNEAGKSNVLKAVAAIFNKYQVTVKDKRKKIDNEIIDKSDYYIRGIILLNQYDLNKIEEVLRNKYTGIGYIEFSSGITLGEFLNKFFKELLIRVNVDNDSKPYFSYWKIKENYTKLKQTVYISNNDISLEGETMLNLEKEISAIAKEYYLNDPIKCHYWQYNDSLLLPSSVEIESFVTSPSNFKALENIFQLCGRENILEEFTNAKEEDGDYANLLEQVSQKVTRTFQKIWADFKGTSIQLLPNDSQILIKISDKAKYNCEDRSDGFKKFISILLMLSTQSRANKIIENDLILIDEPDQSLYPTSAQFLRDELLNIAQKSKIIYSTHSQYMIDTNNLDRHIIVEKKDGITTLHKEDAISPYTTDELLRRAIGSSIFECLKSVNIIFEGYLDKVLFEKYCKWNKRENEFKDFGRMYLKGISGVDNIISILDAANKKFIVVADSDNISNSRRFEFEKEHLKYKSNWLSYADAVSKIITMEDFLLEEYIESELIKYDNQFKYDRTKNAIQNIDKSAEKNKEKMRDIKNNLIENLKKANINEEYSKFLDELKKKLSNLL